MLAWISPSLSNLPTVQHSHSMPCHAMSFQPSTFNPIICRVYFTHHIFGYMFRFYVVWYLFQTSTGSPCLPEPPLLVQGCQLSQVGGIRPICRHRTWRASWDNFRETQSWSWFMLRPTYPYLPGVCRFSAKDEMSKKCLPICFALPQHPELLLWPNELPCLSSRVCIKSH